MVLFFQGALQVLPLGRLVTQTDDLKVAISAVNGHPDTLTFKNIIAQKLTWRITPQSSWIVDIITDLHVWETFWQLTDDQGSVLASGGNPLVGINVGGLGITQESDPGAYHPFEHIQQTINLPGNGCYHFDVIDDKANGMTLSLFGNRLRLPEYATCRRGLLQVPMVIFIRRLNPILE